MGDKPQRLAGAAREEPLDCVHSGVIPQCERWWECALASCRLGSEWGEIRQMRTESATGNF